MIPFKQHPNFHIITGGPGVGKTTLLTELQNRGCPVVPEVARQLITEQQQTNGEALPWKDKELYKQRMFERSVKNYVQTEKNGNNRKPVFFDRSFLDTLCYAQLIGSAISEEMQSYAEHWRYHTKVFILPPWQEMTLPRSPTFRRRSARRRARCSASPPSRSTSAPERSTPRATRPMCWSR